MNTYPTTNDLLEGRRWILPDRGRVISYETTQSTPDDPLFIRIMVVSTMQQEVVPLEGFLNEAVMNEKWL